MSVLIINGSPRADGTVARILHIIEAEAENAAARRRSSMLQAVPILSALLLVRSPFCGGHPRNAPGLSCLPPVKKRRWSTPPQKKKKITNAEGACGSGAGFLLRLPE